MMYSTPSQPMRFSVRKPLTQAFALLASLCALAAPAYAQTAVMLDGRVLTQKVPLALFATEGPITQTP